MNATAWSGISGLNSLRWMTPTADTEWNNATLSARAMSGWPYGSAGGFRDYFMND
jgi:hypothetical protein